MPDRIIPTGISSSRRAVDNSQRRRQFARNDALLLHTIRYDTRCYFNVRSKADMSRLNLPLGNDN